MTRMDCIFINLRVATERRKTVERNISESRFPPAWKFRRLEACDADHVMREAVPGKIRNSEKGCFLSHIKALKLAGDNPAHVLIAEDDTLFSTKTTAAIQSGLDSLRSKSWDILFTDMAVPMAPDMVHFFLLRRELRAASRQILVDLKQIVFAGSTCYIVNGAAKPKLRALFSATSSFDRPYDLYLRDLIWKGELQAYCIFPYATSLAATADTTQNHLDMQEIQIRNLTWNCFRRLMWIGADPEEVATSLANISTAMNDRQTSVFAKLLETALADKFRAPD
jgi:GR25 family glycosyltransferase involved in LPS biosynthesis